MGARRGIEGLMKPAVDVDPPQLAGPVAPQRRFAKNVRAGDRSLDPVRGNRFRSHSGIRFQPRALSPKA
jgi:hypothetical protein